MATLYSAKNSEESPQELLSWKGRGLPSFRLNPAWSKASTPCLSNVHTEEQSLPLATTQAEQQSLLDYRDRADGAEPQTEDILTCKRPDATKWDWGEDGDKVITPSTKVPRLDPKQKMIDHRQQQPFQKSHPYSSREVATTGEGVTKILQARVSIHSAVTLKVPEYTQRQRVSENTPHLHVLANQQMSEVTPLNVLEGT